MNFAPVYSLTAAIRASLGAGAIDGVQARRSRLVSPNELARARTAKGVARFVVFGEIRFRFYDDTTALFPDELGTDQLLGADERISLEKSIRQHERVSASN